MTEIIYGKYKNCLKIEFNSMIIAQGSQSSVIGGDGKVVKVIKEREFTPHNVIMKLKELDVENDFRYLKPIFVSENVCLVDRTPNSMEITKNSIMKLCKKI